MVLRAPKRVKFQIYIAHNVVNNIIGNFVVRCKEEELNLFITPNLARFGVGNDWVIYDGLVYPDHVDVLVVI